MSGRFAPTLLRNKVLPHQVTSPYQIKAHKNMNWNNLLSPKRLSNDGTLISKDEEKERSTFHRDWDRILFSTAFRRMHDKTQVFPLPEDDVVHSRLTHSLEAASVGRSLGMAVGTKVRERENLDARIPYDIGTIVATACLAHDIGNPPFGHSGESAIATFFTDGEGQTLLNQLTGKERADLTQFEGNAQGFRLLTRLQLESDGGLQLTAATLATFTKYPRESHPDGSLPVDSKSTRADLKKHGFHQSERDLFRRIAEEVGLKKQPCAPDGYAWARHPLAFLVEAADDICYSILDIEDGVRLGYVDARDAEAVLRPVAERVPTFKIGPARNDDVRSRIGYLRALAIGQFSRECIGAFLDNEAQILDGTFSHSLSKIILSKDDLETLQTLARKKCYNAASVLEIELAGYEAIGGLLSAFANSALADEPSKREKKLIALMTQRAGMKPAHSKYEKILRVTDYVSGMTDRYALSLFRRIHGISVPGRAL
ncbi:deoxyguanosinetriphosphate triphosphohydrolase [Myxococcus sp. NMCA1]|uniref:deoxyguanosinetriphosphate triphosphohydrolase n=1 Tax=Myxococcus sp. NMCA1 TaxID=2996785 RepID=UPI0022857E2E|nr:deoxyguanosinetriphosphate triphosphohydrolase [Myxococcus sp. NMCA1]WAM28300.1 deoxyguanosinetriphosphate triphosphohydrolase [Myxococcus sp. NMCA1]